MNRLYCFGAITMVTILSVGIGMRIYPQSSAEERKKYPSVVYGPDSLFYKYATDESLINGSELNPVSGQNAYNQSDAEDVEVIVYPLDDNHLSMVLEQAKTENQVLSKERGDNIPTLVWNLDAAGPYQYSISNMQHYVYTGYCFLPDYKNSLAMNMGTLNSGHRNITINLYESGTNISVATWTGDPQTIRGIGFVNLYVNKLYYIKFSISNGSLSGSGYVLHD